MMTLTEAQHELCQPELDPLRIAALAARYDFLPETIVFTLREYDGAVTDFPLSHDHFTRVSKRLEMDENLVGHIVTEYMEMPHTSAGGGKTITT